MTVQITKVLLLPVKWGPKILVNLLSLKLINYFDSFLLNLLITLDKANKDLLILVPSFCLNPSVLLLLIDSLPAKSIRFKVVILTSLSNSLGWTVNCNLNIVWERDELTLEAVGPTFLLFSPYSLNILYILLVTKVW